MDFRTVLVLLVCLCFECSLSKKMKKHISDRDDFIGMLMRQRDTIEIEKRASAVNVKKICNFPELSSIITDENNKIIPFKWSQPPCKTRPIPVRISAPSHLLIYPIYVELYRCLGGVGYSTIEQCAASKREKLRVKYMDLLANVEREAIMYNHTECKKDCIVKKTECNSNTETFKNCICNCNIDASHCNSAWQSFNSHKCDCECKTVEKCDLYKEWNPVTCQCECAKCIRDICTKANLALDTQECKCTIP